MHEQTLGLEQAHDLEQAILRLSQPTFLAQKDARGGVTFNLYKEENTPDDIKLKELWSLDQILYLIEQHAPHGLQVTLGGLMNPSPMEGGAK